MKVRFGLRAKILIFFLALFLISLGLISWLSFSAIYQVSSLVKQNSSSMGEEVARRYGIRTVFSDYKDLLKNYEYFLDLLKPTFALAVLTDKIPIILNLTGSR